MMINRGQGPVEAEQKSNTPPLVFLGQQKGGAAKRKTEGGGGREDSYDLSIVLGKENFCLKAVGNQGVAVPAKNEISLNKTISCHCPALHPLFSEVTGMI